MDIASIAMHATISVDILKFEQGINSIKQWTNIKQSGNIVAKD